MRSYGQYCPVAKAAELLGDRWTLLIVRELLFGPIRFNEMERGLPGISRSVLAARLKRLQRDGIVERTDAGYRFTPAGEALRPVVHAAGEWVVDWVLTDPTPAELDPELLMLFISRHVNRHALPDRRTVLQFEFLDRRVRRIWMTLEPHDVSVCLKDPGLPVDVLVRGSTRDLYRVYMGRTTLEHELREERVQLIGTLPMVRAFPTWMKWSSFSPLRRATRGWVNRAEPPWPPMLPVP